MDDRHPPDPQSWRAHGTRNDSVVQTADQGKRVRIRLWRQDRSPPWRFVRSAWRWTREAVRQLGPVLRLGKVRTRARIVRWRQLDDQLPLARHARRLQLEPIEHAGTKPLEPRGAELGS